MIELLFLLLPIAAGYGWYMGKRNSIYQKQQDESRHSRGLVTGINFLLTDQKEQALELFVAIAKEKEDAFEAHLTLGNLLRARGEIDSALQIHQALVTSDLLNLEQRLLATQQLGKTYLIAGLLDRAEDCFKSLLDEADFKIYALSQLLNIYQSVSDWQQAIQIAKQLIKLGQTEYIKDQAHFYCELAERSRQKSQESIALLNMALSINKNCARASIMLGRIAQEESRYTDAISHYQDILEQDKYRIGEVLADCKFCFDALDQQIQSQIERGQHKNSQIKSESPLTDNELPNIVLPSRSAALVTSKNKPILYSSWHQFILKCIEYNIGSNAHIFYLDLLIQKHNFDAAKSHLKSTLFKNPTLKLLLKFIELQLDKQRDAESQEVLYILKDIIKEHINSKSRYRCVKCGFQAHTLYWHCPSCRKWDTLNIIKGIDGD